MKTLKSSQSPDPRPAALGSRRRFLQRTALASSALSLAPAALVRAAGEKAALEKLNLAGIGVGGMGRSNLRQCAAENIVALCGVDQDYAAKTYKDGHEADWVRACKGGGPASSHFDFSGPLSEMVLMGNLAVRFPNQQLLWDGENMQVRNHKEANAFVRREYRGGWTL